MQRQIKDMVPVLKKLLVSSEDKNTHTLNNIKRITEQQINKLEMINRQSPAFPTLTVQQYTLIVIKTCLKEISCPVWEWKERGYLTAM